MQDTGNCSMMSVVPMPIQLTELVTLTALGEATVSSIASSRIRQGSFDDGKKLHVLGMPIEDPFSHIEAAEESY